MADTKQAKQAERTPETLESGNRLDQTARGSGEVTTSFKDGLEKGFFGEKVDPTPNEHYTAPDPHTNPRPFTGPDLV